MPVDDDAGLMVPIERLHREGSVPSDGLEPARRAALAFERGRAIRPAEVLVASWATSSAAGDPVARLERRGAGGGGGLPARRPAGSGRSRLDLARRTLERQEALGDRGHASTQRLDEAQLSAAVEAARVREIEAALARLDVDLVKSTLVAPFAGTIGARAADPGAVVAAGAPVVDIHETGAPIARIGVAPAAARDLRPGARATLTIDGAAVPARLVAIRPDLDPATPTGPAPLSFELQWARTPPLGAQIVRCACRGKIRGRPGSVPIRAHGPKSRAPVERLVAPGDCQG